MHRTFYSGNTDEVEITNRYGDVIVRAWDLDSVRFDVTLKAEGKTSDAVNKSMSRVDVRFLKVGSVVSAETTVGKNRGFLGNALNNVEGVVGANKLSVVFEVWMPKGLSLDLINKFGDVYLEDLDSDVRITLAHGDMRAGKIGGRFVLEHSFGKVSIRDLKNGNLKLRASELNLDQSERLEIESGSSKIYIGKTKTTEFNSRNDKIEIDDTQHLSGTGSFTDIHVHQVSHSARLELSYGELSLKQLSREFTGVSVISKAVDLSLGIDQASFIQASIKGETDRMVLPNSMLIMSKTTLEDDRIWLAGDVGNTNKSKSKLELDMDGGSLVVAIKDTFLFSEKD